MRNVFLFSIPIALAIMPSHVSGKEKTRKDTVNEPRNYSEIKIQKGPFDLFNNGNKWEVDKCEWKKAPAFVLQKTQLSSEELQKGAYCISGDFDGNGSLDFAIWGKLYSPGPQISETRDNLVLLFDGKKIIHDKVMERRFPLLKYGPTKKKGNYGEPATERPGLIEPGEGDSTDIFLWDSKTKDFVHSEYASEDH